MPPPQRIHSNWSNQGLRVRAILLLLLVGVPANAEGYQPIKEESEFVAKLDGRDLRVNMFNLTLLVASDGAITGSALGWSVTGNWYWQDGYFCRQMDWSGTPIPHNCQLVESLGSKKMRFTTDRGAGESATFDMR